MCGLLQQHVGDGMIVQHSLKKQIETGMNVQRENFPHDLFEQLQLLLLLVLWQ
jgi:hypothetical protein